MLTQDKLAIISVYAPLIGFLLCMLLLKAKSYAISSTLIGMSVALTSTILLIFKTGGDHVSTVMFFDWIHLETLRIGWGIKIDPLMIVMLTVVNSVSFLVHIYSIGYMQHDHAKTRFMGYLSFFTFMMLALISAPNFAQLFVGWEGVGLSSYLLIGFWFERPAASAAAMKAFIVNRVGDVGLILAMAFLLSLFGTLDFDIISGLVKNSGFHAIGHANGFTKYDTICLFMVLAVMGKSAQFGLHVWLPDAMEGPTPVSALIHAATMVTAGVFLVARTYYLFDLAPYARDVLLWLGIGTAFFAGTVALVQNDIKRIIAYSTCSQLGYMVAACGVGAYKSAVFHLVTHAFFKALLFLGAGSVIHAMSGEQDITKMGGIKSFIPKTYVFMWIGTLALIGMPFFAGYYSKDAILFELFLSQHFVPYVIGLFVVALTSFYSLRLLYLTFHGKTKANDYVVAHIHESPRSMLLPLFVLSVGAIFAGYFGQTLFSGGFTFNWRYSLMSAVHHDHLSFYVECLPLLSMVLGVVFAYTIYVKGRVYKFALWNTISHFLVNKWRVDEFYQYVICAPCMRLAAFVYEVIDKKIIDRFGPEGFAKCAVKLSNMHHPIQTGFVYHYAFIMVAGLVLLSALLCAFCLFS